MVRHKNSIFFLFALMLILNGCSQPPNSSPKVLASLHPLALIAASVVAPEELGVIVAKGQSPHSFNLKPSDIEKIKQAEIVIWAGAEIEPYLAELAKNPSSNSKWIDISKVELNSQINNPHKWLSTDAALRIQEILAQRLGVSSQEFAQQINSTKERIQKQLANYQQEPFFVFHNAYGYWVETFGLKQQMAFNESVQNKVGLRSVLNIRKQLEAQQVTCIFSEAQFSKSLILSVVGELDVKLVELDPMGYKFALDKQAYSHYLLDLGNKFSDCLSTKKEQIKK